MSLAKPNRPPLLSLEALAARVPVGARIGIGGHHFARLPLALIKAVLARGEGGYAYIGWAGGLALELFLADRRVSRAVLCFSSLDIFGLPPLFRAAVEQDGLEVEDWPALALIRGLEARRENLPSLPFQVPAGSEILTRAGGCRVAPDPLTGTMVAHAPAVELDAFLMHAPRADEDGNVAIRGALALDQVMAGAAREVLVTVEEIVPRGTLGEGTLLPRNLVSAIAVAPGGAYPTSCLPFYATDYRALATAFAASPPQLPKPAAGRLALLEAACRVPSAAVAGALRNPAPESKAVTPDEMIAIVLSRQYDSNSVCSAGAVSPLAFVSYLLAKHLRAPDLLLLTLTAGHVDIAERPALMLLAEPVDYATARGYWSGEDAYHRLYQGGLVTHEVVAATQIDRCGRTNTVEIRRPDGRILRLPGQGGMADVANMHKTMSIYVTAHSPRIFVPEVDFVGAARTLVTPEERAAVGYRPGPATIVTDLCVFRLNEASRLLEVASVHPGVERAVLAERTGFSLIYAEDYVETAPPTAEELAVLRGIVDPLGMRRLEFCRGAERDELIGSILAREEALAAEFLDGR